MLTFSTHYWIGYTLEEFLHSSCSTECGIAAMEDYCDKSLEWMAYAVEALWHSWKRQNFFLKLVAICYIVIIKFIIIKCTYSFLPDQFYEFKSDIAPFMAYELYAISQTAWDF